MPMPVSTTTAQTASLFDRTPLVIAALHLPDLRAEKHSLPALEDYLLDNMRVFVESGVPAVMI